MKCDKMNFRTTLYISIYCRADVPKTHHHHSSKKFSFFESLLSRESDNGNTVVFYNFGGLKIRKKVYFLDVDVMLA